MNTFGFIRVATACPQVQIANAEYNAQNIIEQISEAIVQGVQIVCFPELSITAYSCEHLFYQQHLLDSALSALNTIKLATASKPIIAIVGCPINHKGKLYNCAVVIEEGHVRGIVPQSYPSASTVNFASALLLADNEMHHCLGENVPFGANLVFNAPTFSFGIETGTDALSPLPPSASLSLAGAEVIFNPAAHPEIVGHHTTIRQAVAQRSLQLSAAYILSANGSGESTQDVVFGGRCFIAEYGSVMAEMPAFDESNKMIIADIDVERLRHKRLKSPCFAQNVAKSNLRHIELQGLADAPQPTALKRPLSTLPFIPEKALRNDYFENILSIQAHGLAKRITHTHAQTAVIGISGGLDSTLALLATVQSFDLLGKDRKQIIGITMPGFGTTGRTYTNALQLMQLLGITTREIRITDAVTQHFKDIDHDINKHDVTYENSQARERTQILMDIANQMNGTVIGTGDLSELALGWATYNGDHMSMYAVNASIPKTMMRFLVTWVAQNTANQQIKSILLDIVDTPVSPELMPADEQGNIKQKTEDLVGPYELHDFFLYHTLTNGYAPAKIFKLACLAFSTPSDETTVYDQSTIKKWLQTFCRRFFNQQFKRSCMPDGPQATECSLSPRAAWHMPSDADSSTWINHIETL